MLKFMKRLIISVAVSGCVNAYAGPTTERTPYFDNNQVNVWKTVIYPSANQRLKMHAHLYNRVVVALTDGKLKVVNNSGDMHYFAVEKGKAYFLKKNPPGEMHTDENVSGHSIKLVVIEIK